MRTLRILLLVLGTSVCVRSFALEPDQVYAKVAPSIVVVVAYKSGESERYAFGSGVIVAPGQIVTNCHVIEEADVIRLNRDKHTTTGIVRYWDLDRDLCQIGAADIRGFEHAVPRITTVAGLKVGQRVFAIGAPQGLELTLSDGLVSSLRVLDEGTIIQTTAPISQGSSGGGLFDSSGRLIGITTFVFKKGQNLNFAVPAVWIGDLAARQKLRDEATRKELEILEVARAEEERRREEVRVAEEQRRIEDSKREEERKQHEASMERERQQQEAGRRVREAEEAKRKAEAAAVSAQQRVINGWRSRIQAKIKNRLLVPPNMEGNPEARFEVVLIPGGEIQSATLAKSSGNAAYDAAVELAITSAQPLPVPSDPDLFQENFRELTLVFRPKGEIQEVEETTVQRRQTPSGPIQNTSLPDPRIRYQESLKIRPFEYPAVARRRRWEGTTVLLVTVSPDGILRNVSIAETSGHEVLDEAAVNAVRRSSPFASFPQEIKDPILTLQFPVRFKLD